MEMREEVCPADCDQAKWYVLFVRSNQERTVENHLCHRAVEYFLPCYSSKRQWKDRSVKLKIPLFPGYIFVRLPIQERLKVLTVPNVVSLVGTKKTPCAVPDAEIEWIRRGVSEGKAVPHPYLKAGDAVVIKTGAMAGMEGTLVQMQNSTRVLICLNSISRAFTVEVESGGVEPAPPTAVVRHAC
jgi:transcriptional antiterminator RfaH